MQLTDEEYLAQLESDHVQVTTTNTTTAKIQEDATITQALDFMADQLASGYLCRYEWQVKMPVGEALSVRLETNLINVPMAEAPRLDPKLLTRDSKYQVKIYMVAEGDDLNKSSLRIDELVADAEAVDTAEAVNHFKEWVADQLAMTVENRKAAE